MILKNLFALKLGFWLVWYDTVDWHPQIKVYSVFSLMSFIVIKFSEEIKKASVYVLGFSHQLQD